MSDDGDVEFEERRKKTIWQRLDDVDSAAAAGHTRLRKSVDALEAQFDALVSEQNVLASKFDALSNGPVDATKLMLTTRAIVGLVGSLVAGALFIGGSLWGLSAKLDAQQKASDARFDKQTQAEESATKIRELQMKSIGDAAADAKNAAADAKRQYELLRYEFQSLKETVIQKGK